MTAELSHMVDRPTCIDCGASAPTTDTNYTLISATFGWRLTRRVLADGSRAVEWRCPTCWSVHKGTTHPAATTLTRPKRPGQNGAAEVSLAEADTDVAMEKLPARDRRR
jgi:hypothetical protein